MLRFVSIKFIRSYLKFSVVISLSESSWIRQTNSQLYMCMSSPFKGLFTTENSSKKIYTKTRIVKVKLIQFPIAHASLLRII